MIFLESTSHQEREYLSTCTQTDNDNITLYYKSHRDIQQHTLASFSLDSIQIMNTDFPQVWLEENS